METSRTPPARRTTEQATPEAERRAQDRELKEQTDKEIAERLSSPPEQPTPTQEEADKLKEGAAITPDAPPEGQARAGETEQQRREREARERQQRDVKPDSSPSGYQTR